MTLNIKKSSTKEYTHDWGGKGKEMFAPRNSLLLFKKSLKNLLSQNYM